MLGQHPCIKIVTPAHAVSDDKIDGLALVEICAKHGGRIERGRAHERGCSKPELLQRERRRHFSTSCAVMGTNWPVACDSTASARTFWQKPGPRRHGYRGSSHPSAGSIACENFRPNLVFYCTHSTVIGTRADF